MNQARLEKLQALRERVRAATGPDRGLDELLLTHFNHRKYYAIRLTDSIDESLALVERVLPGWDVAVFTVASMDGTPGAQISHLTKMPRYNRTAKTTPLAILDAMLTALIEQERG
jgi:hypothetical protein